MSDSEQTRIPKPRVRRMAREPQPADSTAGNLPSPAPRVTKARIVLNLLQRSEGCSLDDLVAATGWQPHTARAVLTGLRKKGHQITSWKPEAGSRIYRIVEAGQ